MSTIEQSAGSEEMQKALEKNPDISKERNNLLQGEHVLVKCVLHLYICTCTVDPFVSQ